MDNEELLNEKRNSITVKKNAKGDYSWDIKLYFDDDNTKVIKDLEDINQKLKTKFDDN